MSKDKTSENLNKFLDSEDPVMITMGLSMAKGLKLEKGVLGDILWIYLMDNDKKLRYAAKSTFMSVVSNEVKEIIKLHWKTSYRVGKGYGGTSYSYGCSTGHLIGKLGFLLKKFDIDLTVPLMKHLRVYRKSGLSWYDNDKSVMLQFGCSNSTPSSCLCRNCKRATSLNMYHDTKSRRVCSINRHTRSK